MHVQRFKEKKKVFMSHPLAIKILLSWFIIGNYDFNTQKNFQGESANKKIKRNLQEVQTIF